MFFLSNPLIVNKQVYLEVIGSECCICLSCGTLLVNYPTLKEDDKTTSNSCPF